MDEVGLTGDGRAKSQVAPVIPGLVRPVRVTLRSTRAWRIGRACRAAQRDGGFVSADRRYRAVKGWRASGEHSKRRIRKHDLEIRRLIQVKLPDAPAIGGCPQ